MQPAPIVLSPPSRDDAESTHATVPSDGPSDVRTESLAVDSDKRESMMQTDPCSAVDKSLEDFFLQKLLDLVCLCGHSPAHDTAGGAGSKW